MKEAKDALGINTRSKILPDETKLAIWQWHVEKLAAWGKQTAAGKCLLVFWDSKQAAHSRHARQALQGYFDGFAARFNTQEVNATEQGKVVSCNCFLLDCQH